MVEGMCKYFVLASVDGILGLVGAIIGVIGAFGVSNYQLKKEIRKEKENQKPILRVTNYSDFINFESPEGQSINIILVNAGETAAINVTITISTFVKRLFWQTNEELALDKIFKKTYSVIMGGDNLVIPIITNIDDAIKVTDSNVIPIIMPSLLSKWKDLNGISFFVDVTYSDREKNNFTESQAITLRWSRIKYTDDSFTTPKYANYSVQEGFEIPSDMFSLDEFNKAIANWKK